MQKKQEQGNVLVVITLLIAVAMTIALTMLERGFMHYNFAQIVKQTANTDLLAETTVLQCKEGVNHLIRTKMQAITERSTQKVAHTVSGCQTQLNQELLEAYVLEEVIALLEGYYFKSSLYLPIEMNYQVKSDRRKEDRTAYVYTRLYLGDSNQYIERKNKELNYIVKKMMTSKENNRLILLIEKGLTEELSPNEMNELEQLREKVWKECHFIIETIVEVKNKKGLVFDKKRMLAGVKINVKNDLVKAEISWMQQLKIGG